MGGEGALPVAPPDALVKNTAYGKVIGVAVQQGRAAFPVPGQAPSTSAGGQAWRSF